MLMLPLYRPSVINDIIADAYGDSEDLLGAWFKKRPEVRSNIVLCTKFANKGTGITGKRIVDSSPEYAKEACAKSLSRLGVDTIDLYYCHRLDSVTPIEQTVRAMEELRKEGKIKYLGLSECSSQSLRRACKVAKISAVQLEYSPFAMDIETEQVALLKTARELGVAIVAYSPVGRGILTGTLKSPDDFEKGDFRLMAPRFSKENFPKNLELVDKLKGIAEKKGCTPAQLALAWLVAQGDDIIPIPGTTKWERYQENMEALNVKLTSEEDETIRKLAKEAEPAGTRYPPNFMHACFADTPEE